MRIPIITRRREKALSATREVIEALQDRRINPYPVLGGTNTQAINFAYQRGLSAQYGWIYATQPAVRSVIDFIARNLAQLSLKLYKRVSDIERERLTDHPAIEAIEYPDQYTTRDSFLYRLVTDYLIWDNAYVLKFPSESGRLILVRLPPDGVQVTGGRFTPETYIVWRYDGTAYRVAPSDMMHWFGYNPSDPLLGLSKLETLRNELAADAAVQATLVELAKNALKGGYIRRPLDAPELKQEGLMRVAEFWRAEKKKGDPILDEGMEYIQTGVTPKDAQLNEARVFTKEEVASVYGVPLGVLGIGEGSPTEQRKLIYQDVLPPHGNSLACQLNLDILREVYGDEDLYFEFDYSTKLQGDLENRFPQFTAATGAPWMTRNEVRAKENLPPIEGADDLIKPLNVTEEGDEPPPNQSQSPQLPAPNVMPPQDPTKPPADGSYRSGEGQVTAAPAKAIEPADWEEYQEWKAKQVPGAVGPHQQVEHYRPKVKAEMARQRRHADKLQALIYKEYERQKRVLDANGGTWNAERFNAEMKKAIGPHIKQVVQREGDIYAAKLGAEEFDDREIEHWLEAMVAGTALGLNAATKRSIDSDGVEAAYKLALGSRAAIAGAQIVAHATYFGRKEGAMQAPHPNTRKQRWIADTDRHASLDGKSVGLGEAWDWRSPEGATYDITPGSTPNCQCGCVIE